MKHLAQRSRHTFSLAFGFEVVLLELALALSGFLLLLFFFNRIRSLSCLVTTEI